MKTIEINDVKTYIDEAPIDMCLMFVGDTGIGKTSVISKYAEENGYHFKTLVLSQLRADEALGLPVSKTRVFNGKEYDVLTSAIPEWVLELQEQPKALLFLDEFLTAKPDVMNAFLNFLTERKVSGIDLTHVKIVAATNIGMYSFQPDMNILSRFCMFYTVNTTYNKFIGDERIENVYVDETNKNHNIFEERSLKPRCQYLLSKIKNDELLEDFYEGFTNSRITPNFFDGVKLNNFFVSLYRDQTENKGFVKINEDNIGLFIQFISDHFPRIKDISKTIFATKNVKFPDEIHGQDLVEFINFRLEI